MQVFIYDLFMHLFICNDDVINSCEISSSHGGEYDVQSCINSCYTESDDKMIND
jgi:hypothetical protein